MARPKSVVLSPAEKKAALTDAKAALKNALADVKRILAARKEIEKAHAAATKAHLSALKDNDKLHKQAQDDVNKLAAYVAALSPQKAVA